MEIDVEKLTAKTAAELAAAPGPRLREVLLRILAAAQKGGTIVVVEKTLLTPRVRDELERRGFRVWHAASPAHFCVEW